MSTHSTARGNEVAIAVAVDDGDRSIILMKGMHPAGNKDLCSQFNKFEVQ